MNYRVRPTEAALADAAGIRDWIAEQGAPLNAERWVDRLLEVLGSLESHPKRWRVAPEDQWFEGFEIRQLVFGSYRVLFTIVEPEVVILHVRHGRRRYASKEEMLRALEELDEPPEAP